MRPPNLNQLLIQMVRYYRPQDVRKYLELGAEPSEDNSLALALATERGNKEMIWDLVRNGAEIHPKNPQHDSLLLAASMGNFGVMDLLIKLGGDLDRSLDIAIHSNARSIVNNIMLFKGKNYKDIKVLKNKQVEDAFFKFKKPSSDNMETKTSLDLELLKRLKGHLKNYA